MVSRLPSAEAVDAVVSSLERSHDLVVLDMGAYLDDPIPASCLTIMVVAAEVKAVMAAYSKIVGWGLNDAAVAVRRGPGWNLEPDIVSQTLGLPLIRMVPHDSSLLGLAEAGIPPGMKKGKYARACDSILTELMSDECA